MAYIRAIDVARLATRGITVRRPLNREVNVFFGANGSGKTSLLRILHSALNGRSKELRRVAFSDATIEIEDAKVYLPRTEKPYRGRVIRTTRLVGVPVEQLTALEQPLSDDFGVDPAKRVGEKKKTWHTFPEELASEPLELRHTYLPISRLYINEDRRFIRSRRDSTGDPIVSETELDEIFTDMVNFLWLRYTRNTSLEIQRAQSMGISDILADFLASDDDAPAPFAADTAAAYKRLQAFLDRQPRRRSSVITQEGFERRIKGDYRMQLVLKDIENIELEVERIRRPRTEFESVLREMISSEKTVQLGDRDIHAFAEAGEIDLGDLSSGEKQLLRICIDVLLADGEPVLIDEPELSMHIDWQRRLIPALRALAPESQRIVATHSPEIMASLKDYHIFEL
jgi:predicted ATP-binding protein involved in virulence